jgi:hypothetical protein
LARFLPSKSQLHLISNFDLTANTVEPEQLPYKSTLSLDVWICFALLCFASSFLMVNWQHRSRYVVLVLATL